MTPLQQTALEALMGRSMSTDEITLAGTRSDRDLAISMSVGLKAPVKTPIGYGTVLATLGLTIGNALLDAVNGNPMFKYLLPDLQQGMLQLDHPMVQASLNSLAASGTIPGFDATQAAKMIAVCMQPISISTDRVSAILNGGAE